MRVNIERAWAYVPLSTKLTLLWERITLSRLTTFYFIFSFLHFTVQLGLQIQAFVINAHAASLLSALVNQGNATLNGFTVWDGALRMCETAPSSVSAESCEILWQPTSMTDNNTINLSNGNTTAITSSSISSTISFIPASYPVVKSSASLAFAVPVSSVLPSGFAVSVASSMSVRSSTATSPARSSSTISFPASSVPVVATRTELISTSTSVTTKTLTVAQSVTPSSASRVSLGDDTTSTPGKDIGQDHPPPDRRSISTKAIDRNGQEELRFSGDGFSDVTLDFTCLTVLNWPVSQLDNTKREDITFIMFQFWLLAMSLVALLNESIPHIIATLLMHIAATAWGGFQIFDTAQFHDDFSQLTTNGACGTNLLPTYWTQRAEVEIPSLVLNGVALLVSGVLSWRLIKSFGWQTFKRVGASRTINRIYNVVLLLSISIQVALFFIAVTAGLWIDQLINGDIGCFTMHSVAFKVIDIVVLVILVPWLSLGWIAVRREKRFPMLIFLLLAVVYLCGWGSMFAAATFRWTFVQWRFFSIMASISVLIAVVTLALGIVCRINFGKGLPLYLNGEEPLPDDDDFLPTVVDNKDVEKADFPSTDILVPTYMGSSLGHKEPAARAMGPRFFNTSLQPFDSQPDAPPVYDTLTDVSGSPMSSRTAVGVTNGLKRNSSNASGSSNDSTRSKRWVIE